MANMLEKDLEELMLNGQSVPPMRWVQRGFRVCAGEQLDIHDSSGDVPLLGEQLRAPEIGEIIAA